MLGKCYSQYYYDYSSLLFTILLIIVPLFLNSTLFISNRLSFKPKKATALLFYSQTGSGVLDEMSLHGFYFLFFYCLYLFNFHYQLLIFFIFIKIGACPVLKGTKWYFQYFKLICYISIVFSY